MCVRLFLVRWEELCVCSLWCRITVQDGLKTCLPWQQSSVDTAVWMGRVSMWKITLSVFVFMFSFLSVSVTWFLAVVVSVAFSCAALLFLLFLYFWVADTHCLGWCLMPSDQTHSNSDNQIHISLLKHLLPCSRPWLYDSHLWSRRCQFCHQWNRSYTLPWRAFKFVVTGLPV